MKKISFLLMLALLLTSVTSVMALEEPTPTYTEVWDGRGTDSEDCDKVGEGGRTETGWIHWIFSTKGASTNALLTLGGTGSGVYTPAEPLNANTWHFFTPFFELDALTARIDLFGGLPGSGGGLVISDYCPGYYEELDVTKTVNTSFTREHFWDITKEVKTKYGYELDELPKIWLYTDGSGNEWAKWIVDVTYEDYEDKDFQVWGSIYIENTGMLDAVILSVEDVLGGVSIPVSCLVTFPYTLPVGDILTCTYSEEGYFEGYNEVEVTTERATYTDSKLIPWGAPTTEINKTITVKDESDLFGIKDLGQVTAPNNATFKYWKYFKFADYGADSCGHFEYDNTAWIVETGQEASATLLVNVQCFVYQTAYAMGGSAICFIPTFSNWGWTKPIMPGGPYVWELWAAAAQCNTSKGTLVGTVTVSYSAEGYVTVIYNVDPGFMLKETHVYAGYGMFPVVKGKQTVAPGAYTNASPFDGSQVYVIAHAVVGLPDPNFGPLP